MNILITGTTKGIGRAIAETALESGLNVFASGRNEDLLKTRKNEFIPKVLPSLKH